jgi:hypothetical protein
MFVVRFEKLAKNSATNSLTQTTTTIPSAIHCPFSTIDKYFHQATHPDVSNDDWALASVVMSVKPARRSFNRICKILSLATSI